MFVWMFNFSFLLLWTIHTGSASQMCYVCSGMGSDRLCELSPHAAAGPVAINCTAKYCTAVKVITRETGESHSMARLCENQNRGNWCVHDADLITCYITCSDDYCNSDNPQFRDLPIAMPTSFTNSEEEDISLTMKKDPNKNQMGPNNNQMGPNQVDVFAEERGRVSTGSYPPRDRSRPRDYTNSMSDGYETNDMPNHKSGMGNGNSDTELNKDVQQPRPRGGVRRQRPHSQNGASQMHGNIFFSSIMIIFLNVIWNH